ncbi:UNVERIFIED_CONTAM: hypothetical protein GTU68_066896 [Idotea baltica]|nr:hypothetical protein [Idotea baltica]
MKGLFFIRTIQVKKEMQ